MVCAFASLGTNHAKPYGPELQVKQMLAGLRFAEQIEGINMENNSLRSTQYVNDQKFNARIVLHTKYGVNKTPWPIWLFSQYSLTENERIIEFGCGNGLLWKVNSFRVNQNWDITLSDFSQGMIDAAKESIGNDKITYKVIDMSTFVDDKKYTKAIANHMLYHVEKRDKAIQNVSSILDDNGILYASTVGNDDMKEMSEIISGFTGNNNYKEAKGSITESFSLENGSEQLKKYFEKVDKKIYEDSLEINSAADLANYVLSCNDLKPGITVLKNEEKEEFVKYLKRIIDRQGKIHITKSSGMFIASKTNS